MRLGIVRANAPLTLVQYHGHSETNDLTSVQCKCCRSTSRKEGAAMSQNWANAAPGRLGERTAGSREPDPSAERRLCRRWLNIAGACSNLSFLCWTCLRHRVSSAKLGTGSGSNEWQSQRSGNGNPLLRRDPVPIIPQCSMTRPTHRTLLRVRYRQSE